MDLLIVGSANQYAKSMARKTQWNLKRQSGDLTGHKKSLSDYVNITKASSVLPQTDEADSKMSSIMTKAQAGRKLSYDEWEYLRVKNPVMYEKLREIEKEQKAYEEELKRCKTKDEARRLHMSKLGDILTAAKNGDESALVRLNRLTRTMTEFTESDEYHELPTEAEEAIERENEREARQEALRLEAEIREAESKRETESRSESENEPISETEAEVVVESETEPASDAEAEAVAETEAEPVSDPKTEHSPETKSEAVAETKSDFKAEAKASPSPERKAAPVLSFGHREYVNRRDGVSRRRTFDANA